MREMEQRAQRERDEDYRKERRDRVEREDETHNDLMEMLALNFTKNATDK